MMAEARVVALHTNQSEEPEEESLRDQVNEVLGDHQENLKSLIRKWMLYWTDFGVRTLNLDTCPIPLSEPDRKFVVEWLREEKFNVRASRFGRRVIIDLTPVKD